MGFNYERFLEITKSLPQIDSCLKKEPISKETRIEISIRDKMTCQLCGLKDSYGNSTWGGTGKLGIHHIIPNGSADPINLITLCGYCHDIVHLVLYRDKRWYYIPRI